MLTWNIFYVDYVIRNWVGETIRKNLVIAKVTLIIANANSWNGECTWVFTRWSKIGCKRGPEKEETESQRYSNFARSEILPQKFRAGRIERADIWIRDHMYIRFPRVNWVHRATCQMGSALSTRAWCLILPLPVPNFQLLSRLISDSFVRAAWYFFFSRMWKSVGKWVA